MRLLARLTEARSALERATADLKEPLVGRATLERRCSERDRELAAMREQLTLRAKHEAVLERALDQATRPCRRSGRIGSGCE